LRKERGEQAGKGTVEGYYGIGELYRRTEDLLGTFLVLWDKSCAQSADITRLNLSLASGSGLTAPCGYPPRPKLLRVGAAMPPIALFDGRGCCALFFLAQGAHRKKLVAAGGASQCREPESAAEKCDHAWNVLGGDALQFQVAANSAMRVQECAKRHQPRVESRRAGFAAPRQYTCNGKEVIRYRPASGSSGIRTVTNRAACRAGSDRYSPHKA
jgi:hypothetical protein